MQPENTIIATHCGAWTKIRAELKKLKNGSLKRNETCAEYTTVANILEKMLYFFNRNSGQQHANVRQARK
jgi:hypothetical protein